MSWISGVFSTFFGLSLFFQSEEKYLIKVSDIRIVAASENDDPGIRENVYYITFAGAVHNNANTSIALSEGHLKLGITEMKLASGEWKTIIGSPSSIGIVAEKQTRCASIKSNKTHIFPKLSGMIVTAKDNGKARGSVYVRFHYFGECLDGSVWRIPKFVTEPIMMVP